MTLNLIPSLDDIINAQIAKVLIDRGELGLPLPCSGSLAEYEKRRAINHALAFPVDPIEVHGVVL